MGEDKTCRNKIAYPSEESAGRAALSHNQWKKKQHDVEPYPCGSCGSWHVGRVWRSESMQETVDKSNDLC